jgi:threonine dehydratase
MLTLGDVRRAAATLRPYLRPTPLRRSSLFPDSPVYLKLECWQPTGSFKVRGATNVMASLSPDERSRGVVAASAGNHALGVAFAAQALGGSVATTVFVPATAPRAKVDKLRRFPITVHEEGATYDDAEKAALAFRARTGAIYVPAYEDDRTAAGQGTAGLEILEDLADVDTLLVPVGGGGLISGIAVVAKALSPAIRIVAVQPDASPSLRESLREGRALLTFPAGPTLADGLAGGIGQIVFDHRHLIDEVVTVAEADTEDAIAALLAHDQVVSEGSGAVGVAALRSGRVTPRDGRPVAVVVTGGNVDAPILARLLARYA